jgi:hypothetical protein
MCHYLAKDIKITTRFFAYDKIRIRLALVGEVRAYILKAPIFLHSFKNRFW